MNVPEAQLKEFILDSGLVSRKELEAAELDAKGRGKSLADTLVLRGALTEDMLRKTYAYILGIPFVTLLSKTIAPEMLVLIPEPVARKHNIVAYAREGNAVEVALIDLADLSELDPIKERLGLTLLPRLTTVDSIKHALMQYQKFLKRTFGDAITKESNQLKGGAESASRLVDAILAHGVSQGATDIHLDPFTDELLVRYRISGYLHDAMSLPGRAASAIVARLKTIANLPPEPSTLPLDGRFRMEREGEKISFRLSSLPTASGEKVVLRVLGERGEGFSLESLGFHGESLEQLHRVLHRRSGLIVVAGPLNSGKTTLLYTLLDMLNTPQTTISTVEDGVEYRLARVNQTEIDRAAGYTFPNALRALLRQDPDIVMIGDLRDQETATLALHAALGGKLVLAAMTADSTFAVVEKLLGWSDRELVATALKAVVSTRLARRLSDWKEPYLLKNETLRVPGAALDAAIRTLRAEQLVDPAVSDGAIPFYRAKSSPESADGYKGKIGLEEVVVVSPALRELIERGVRPATLQNEIERQTPLSLLADGIYKCARGLTSLEEVLSLK